MLVVNVEQSRFLLKSGSHDPATVDIPGLVAIGTAGLLRANAQPAEGHHGFLMNDLPADVTDVALCLENDTAAVLATEQTVCDDGVIDAYLTSTDGDGFHVAADVLVLSADDRTALAGFAALLADGTHLTADDLPTDGTNRFPTGVSDWSRRSSSGKMAAE